MNSLQVNLASYQTALSELPFGKKLPGAIYTFWDESFEIPLLLRKIVLELKREIDHNNEFNVIKFHRKELKLSLLCYPGFSCDPHPRLHHSLIVNLASGRIRKNDFTKSLNPPILHRKETFLPGGHPDFEKYRKLTRQEEAAGLYEKTSSIGFLQNWEQLLGEKGLALEGHQLVRRASPCSTNHNKHTPRIDRHKTAISRSELSKPVKTLLDFGQLDPKTTLFDYGCGLGDDVGGLIELGYAANGWDPWHAPGNKTVKADIVNLGFVLNVIEDPAERIDVLTRAWSLTEKLIVVSVLIAGQETYSSVKAFGDGVITNRNTFQKHYLQEEFLGLVETTLDVEPVPVGLGICYAFRDVADQQDFISQRTRRNIDWEQVNQRLRALRPTRLKLSVYERDPDLLDEYWHTLLQLGRTPRPHEFDQIDEIRSLCGSANKATDLFVDKHGPELLDAARQRRREDLLVYLAAGEFQKRRTPFAHLSRRLKTDLKTFFGTYSAACDEARDLLFASGDSDLIEELVSELDFGWFDATEGHFTIHRSLITQLPPVLRMYIECGARLYGDPSQADLIKIHAYSGKLTFLHFLDFDTSTLPELLLRIKVDLRRQFVNVIDHSAGRSHQILFFKERFMPTDCPERKQMESFSSRLRKLGMNESHLGTNDRGAPTKEEFQIVLDRLNLTKGLNKKRLPA